MIKTVELFAGVGGFRIGLSNASGLFQFIWANQWEPLSGKQYAFECYTHHFGVSENHVCKDIRLVKSNIPEHDLLVGGFPCQDYSIANKNAKGIEGEKGALWWDILSIINDKKPKYILLENVDRLIKSPSKQEGRDFSVILRSLSDAGYAVEWRIINASDYGQAQRRIRTFIFAYHQQTKLYIDLVSEAKSTGLKRLHQQVIQKGIFAKSFQIRNFNKSYLWTSISSKEYETLNDVFKTATIQFRNAGIMIEGKLYSIDVVPKTIEPKTIRDILMGSEVDKHYYVKDFELKKWLYEKNSKNEVRYNCDGSNYFFREGRLSFPDSVDKPSRTILTSEGQLKRTSHVILDPKTHELRVLTPLECERLNGFPDQWTATGMPEKARYFCMGNALVVPLVTRIGINLLEIYNHK